MPATKLSKRLFNPAKQREEFNQVVCVCMARKRIRTQEQLAEQLHMTPSALSRRMTSGGWKDVELWRAIYVLEPTPEELVRMMSVQMAAPVA